MNDNPSGNDTEAPTKAPPCPRCGGALFDNSEPARFYGPCSDCRQQLRESLRGEISETTAAEYEPKMNVTPNAVALKDD